jgi:serine/threonine-protein kinase RIM15
MRAKRESIEKHRHECAESGDDEDEELGDAAVREKSPRGAATKAGYRGSKLGTEMMRTNSRGSVVSVSDLNASADTVELPPTVSEEISAASEITGSTLTPPEVFSTPGGKVSEIDLNETPRPTSLNQIDPMDEEPTPRAPSAASNHPPTYENFTIRLKGGD